ncbi:MAG: hypothetical protein R3Y27_00245 [Clostridia bacterium]
MAYNSNTARKVEYVYKNNKLTAVQKQITPQVEEKQANVIIAKIAALVLSVTILSSVYVYSHAALYSAQAQVNVLEQSLEFNKSNYTQNLTKFNNLFTEDFVKTYATENLGFTSVSSSVTYITTETEQVQVYK